MCKGNDSFMSRFKQNHELHMVIIAGLLYWQSKNIMLSGGVAGLVYYVMIIKEKKEKKRDYCACEEKRVDTVKVVQKSNVNNYSYPWSVM